MTRVSDHQTGNKGRRRREEILETAAELFVTRGYDLCTAQDIANALGVAKGGLYYYFGSKEEILFQLLLRNQQRLFHHVVEDTKYAALSGAVAISTFVARHVLYVLTHRAVSLLYADEGGVVRSVEPWWEALVTERRRYEHALRQLVEAAQMTGVAFAGLDPTLTTRGLLALANGPLRWFQADGQFRPEAIAAHHADLALRLVSV